MSAPWHLSVWHMKLLLIMTGNMVPGPSCTHYKGNENASSRAGSRARTKTAACGAANRGFESHPARFLPFVRKERHFGLLRSVVRYYYRFVRREAARDNSEYPSSHVFLLLLSIVCRGPS